MSASTRRSATTTPFGGNKMSGVGRDGGVFGLYAYSELQSVVWPG
jgi:acyl-CoA reductase-like NAD-dependent aldehyde dehydrogenase